MGIPGAGGSFDGNGALCGQLLSSLVFGTLGRPPSRREQAVRRLFSEAGFTLREQPDFRGWVWLHFVTDAGLHSQGLRVGSLSKLAGSASNLREALLTTRELLSVVAARGIDLRQHRSSVFPLRAPSWLVAGALAWATSFYPPARRAFQVHSNTEAHEPRAICFDTWTEAKRLGIAIPRMEAVRSSFLRN